MKYVDASAAVTVGGDDDTSWVSVSGDTLTCDLSSMKGGQTLTLTYKSELMESELETIWAASSLSKSYTNTIVAEKGGSAADNVEGTGTATVTVTKSNWADSVMLAKTGVASTTSGVNNWTVNWTVTVKTCSRSFKNLTLEDTMGTGLTLDESTIKVVNESGNDITSSVSYSKSTSSGSDVLTVDLVKNSVPSTAESTYVITYTTNVNSDYFNQTGTSLTVTNSAKLKYEWPDGIGTSGEHYSPTVSKTPSGISNSMITKSAGTYNAVDHSIPWTITVNPRQVDLTSAVISDDLSSSSPAHKFVPDGETEADVKAGIESAVETGLTSAGLDTSLLTSVELENNKLVITLGDIGENKFSFTVKSYVSDPNIWASNITKTFYNTAYLLKGGTTVGSVAISNNISATTSKSITSNVLKKENLTYNPSTKKLTWRLTVNANATDLGDVTITDKLPDGLSCDTDDALLNGSPFSGNNTFSFDNSTNTITVNLPDVTTKDIITFTTTVDVNSSDFLSKDVVDFSNTAYLVSEKNSGNTVTSNTASLEFTNTVLDKEAVKDSNNLIVHYTVNLNPYSMNLIDGLSGVSDIKLQDTFDDGLYIDLSTVKLYKATAAEVSPSSNVYTLSMTKGDEVSTSVAFDSATRTLEVDIPDATGQYILTYDAYIVRTGVNLTNNIQLVGTVIPSSGSKDEASSVVKVSASGSAKISLPSSKFITLKIEKIDESEKLLKGAEFGLYSGKSDSDLLVNATCDDSTGICTLAVPTSSVGSISTLYWKEIKAPTGYALSTEWHELDIASYDPDKVIEVVNVATTDADNGQIEIKKVDKDDTSILLSGAEFGLYSDKECTVPVTSGGTDVKGTSDSHGLVYFTGLYPSQTYYVKELTAPDGYLTTEKIYAVTAKKTISDSDIVSIPDEKADVTLNVTKVDAVDSSINLKGAQFGLYKDAECTALISDETTDNYGKASFAGLFPYKTYYLKEIAAPTGYIPTTSVFTIKTGDNKAAVTKKLENYAIGWNEKASIQVTKTDEEGSKRLEGARFVLYKQDKITLVDEQVTDQNGICTFTNLAAGTYYVKETVAPRYYILSNDFIEVDVHQNMAETITVKDKKIHEDEEEPTYTPSKDGNSDNSSNSDNSNNSTNSNNSDNSNQQSEPNSSSEQTNSDTSDNSDKNVDMNINESEASGTDEAMKPATTDVSVSKEGVETAAISTSDANQMAKSGAISDMLPKTGVETHLVFWVFGLMLSFITFVLSLVFWKRQKKKIN